MGIRILVVDDEPSLCQLLKDVLERQGHEVEAVTSGEAALEVAARETIDLVFLDIKMPGMNGVETLGRLKQLQPDTTYVMITGYADSDLLDECMTMGAGFCLSKPVGVREVLDMVGMVTEGAADQPVAAPEG